ncbi:hypothetical protein Goklo_003433 [Gossypium klotzschianum]|uniref:Uncharacterized protein n=1 Tax=Gossypium klotzschianum TaxID=34286 RepID=A0A7J8VL15_9ROSI|nr:hypothetical protein [Gossypium klotzschianum]
MGEEHLSVVFDGRHSRGNCCFHSCLHRTGWFLAERSSHSPRRASLLVFHGDGRCRSREFLDLGGYFPLYPHFFTRVRGFSSPATSEPLPRFHLPILLRHQHHDDFHSHHFTAGSFGEEVDCNANVCGCIPSHMHICIVSIPFILPVLRCCSEEHFGFS